MHRIFSFLSSLRLTVVCLALALVLIFVGTLAQVDLGLYAAQSKYFRALLVYWAPGGGDFKIPVLPGGWLLGIVLLVNLLAAHIKRFNFTPKKYGIILIHAGLIFLLAGQFITEVCQVESTMRIEVGQAKNYTEAPRKNELVLIDTSDPKTDRVISIPESLVAQGGEIHTPSLPFALKIDKYAINSKAAGPMTAGEKFKATDGIGSRLEFTPLPPATGMETEDNPVALVQVVGDKGPVGQWSVSTWFTRYPEFARLDAMIGSMFKDTPITKPQTFTYAGHKWEIALRPLRYYKPYSVKLLSFHHDLYAGTDIPKNFSSKIHLTDPGAGEDRDVLIYMNNPLRYRGETFYQASFEEGDTGTILQVVRNPASITPYLACSLVALGLVVQFLMHLIGFARKRLKATPAPDGRKPVPTELAAAGKRNRL